MKRGIPPVIFGVKRAADQHLGSENWAKLLAEVFRSFTEIVSTLDTAEVRKRTAAVFLHSQSLGLFGEQALAVIKSVVEEHSLVNLDPSSFAVFYRFVFFLCRDRNRKYLQVDRAMELWRILLTGRFRLLGKWCSFVQDSEKSVISEDTWRQVLDFSRQVHEDLRNYDPSSAWAVLLDEFVEYLWRHRARQRCEGVDESNRMNVVWSACMQPLSPSAGSKRKDRDVEEVLERLSTFPMMSSEDEEFELGDLVKKLCIQSGEEQKGLRVANRRPEQDLLDGSRMEEYNEGNVHMIDQAHEHQDAFPAMHDTIEDLAQSQDTGYDASGESDVDVKEGAYIKHRKTVEKCKRSGGRRAGGGMAWKQALCPS